MKIFDKVKVWFDYKRRQIVHESGLFRSFMYDYMRFRKYSCYYPNLQSGDVHNIGSLIIREAHGIEKGFTLPDVRMGFGKLRIQKMISLMSKYLAQGGNKDDLAMQKGRSVIGEYVRFHEKFGYTLGTFTDELLEWADMSCDIGGYFEVTRNELGPKATGDFIECALTRCSVRNYSSEKVSRSLILEAVEIARKTPSVCNRQPWHVYILEDEKLKMEVLKLQDGGIGFAEKASFLAIVTGDLKAFIGWGERNEVFVDGGLFSMSLMYAFHYKKLGACPLNWMVTPEKDRKIRQLLGINPSENIIMLFAVGLWPEKMRISKSVRKKASELVTFL